MNTFEPRKTFTELGLDTTKKFIVVAKGYSWFDIWDILAARGDLNDTDPKFERLSDGLTDCTLLEFLAYEDESFVISKERLQVLQSFNLNLFASDNDIEIYLDDNSRDICSDSHTDTEKNLIVAYWSGWGGEENIYNIEIIIDTNKKIIYNRCECGGSSDFAIIDF